MRLGGVDGQVAVRFGRSKRTFEAVPPDWMLRLTSGFLQNSALTVPDTPAPPARTQDSREDPKQKSIGILDNIDIAFRRKVIWSEDYCVQYGP